MSYRALVASILLQATKDYCETQSKAEKTRIIRDLRSQYMRDISDDQSVIIAEQLLKHTAEIADRLRRHTTEA